MKRAIISVFAAGLALATLPAQAQVEGPGGHYYKVVLQPSVTWEDAKTGAEQSTFNGVTGHLATISSTEEDQFIENLRIEAAPGGYNALWVGGYQEADANSATDGWYWINGEGAIATRTVEGGYSNWQAGEPNDYWGPRSENYLAVGHFNTFGWNDYGNDGSIYGYVIEYPSAGRASVVKVSAPDPIAIEHSGQNQPTPSPLDTARFVFTRSGNLNLDLPVYYSIHGTAVNGADYNEITKTIIIPAGQSEVQLQIVPRPDALTVVEKMETVGIRLEPSMILTPSAGYDIDPLGREAGAVIYEFAEDTPDAAELAIPGNGFSYKLGETVTFLVAVDHSAQSVAKVDYYAGTTLIGSKTYTEPLLGLEFLKFDWKDAPAGTHEVRARVTLSSGVQLTTRGFAINVVAPSVPTVGIRYVPPTTTEPVPLADYAPGALEVVRVGSTTGDLQVFYSVGGTATADVDYEALQGYVVIPAGKATAKILVVAKDDVIDEPNETVVVTIVAPPAAPANPIDSSDVYSIDPEHKAAEVVIYDDDPEPPAHTVSIAATHEETIENGTSPGTFRVAREGGSTTEPLTVVLQYTGTATPGTDYVKLSENVVIPAGAFAVEVQVRPIDDQLVEGQETVIATLAPLRGVLYNIAPNANTATVRIIDNDVPTTGPTIVRIYATDAEATEFPPNADGFNPARFLIERDGSVANDLQVFYSIHGTAKNGEDYERIASPVTIPAGKSSAEIQIVPLSDRINTAHKYQIVAEPNLTWEQARIKAEEMTYEGVKGHLATITSAAEDELIESLRMEAGGPHLWVGGYQEPGETSMTEGWKWVNNEGSIPGSNESVAGYANWRTGEPNDYWGAGSENQMVIGWGGYGWNDQGGGILAQGYVVEFDLQAAVADEKMETVGLRLEPSPVASPLPSYAIDDYYHTAAAVIFDGAAPADGAIEIAIPSPEEIYGADHVDFWVAAYHPTVDVQRVEFFVDDVNVGMSYFERTPMQGGVIQHRLVWDAPKPGRHVLQAKATLSNGTVLVSSRIPFTVEAPVNQLPVVSVGSPDDGDTFIEGTPIEIRAEASDSDGTVSKVEVFLNGNLMVTQPGQVATFTWLNPGVGSHTITARATDNSGGVGTSQPVHILVRHREAVAFVHRELPAAYTPGVSFVVELRADPPEGTFAYAVEDRPPTGWRVSEVSDDGAFDIVNGKVKFGPFLDDSARTLKYRLTPPSTATGAFEFTGSSSVNGATYPITGDSRIELARQYHPADTNQDFRIVMSEVTAYAAAWKAGRTWPTGPVPIPLNYVTRAHHIWQRGETYRFDPAAGAAPACWVPTSGGAGASLASSGTATRSMFGDMRADAATQVRITATPPTGSSGYAVEERPPYGWTISNISHEGVFDTTNGVIRWGVFPDGLTRTLSYTATPPAAVSSVGVFAGQLSFDGKLLLIGADSRFENSVSIDGATPVQLSCQPASTGLKLNITGPSGQTGVIEASTDFNDWTEVKSIFIPSGSVEFTDDSPATERRFYRLRVQ